MVAVIDYGAGNIRSVMNALKFLGAEVRLTFDESEIKSADAVVLPGVGSFGAAMKSLESRGLVKAVKDSCASGKPFLGICLGLQLLFEESEESKGIKGLGIFNGQVKKLRVNGNKIPHMGFSTVENAVGIIGEGQYYYFVHSYAAEPKDESVVAARCTYGESFVAAVEKDNVLACQFHPEKSSAAGLELLEKFLKRAKEI